MTTKMRGFFVISQSCYPFTSFCHQIQYAFSFTVYCFSVLSCQLLAALLTSRDMQDGDSCQYLI